MPENLLDSPILYSLALTLLHFLWQGCLVALILKCLLSVTPYKNPQLRYLCSAAALIASLLLPIITFSTVYTPELLAAGPENINTVIAMGVDQIPTVINASWYQTAVDGLPFLSIAWLITVFILSIKLFFTLQQVNHLAQLNTLPVDSALQARFEQLISSFNLWRKPQLLISYKVDVPMAIGWLKPVILLPTAMISGLTSEQLEMLILHELAHIKRHDYLVNFLQTLVEILLFFHPGVRWISTQMRNEREYCSDDIAVAHCGNAIAYAHTLADTASVCHKHRHSSIPTMAMAASGGDLKQRVVRLIDQQHNCNSESDSGKLLASIIILFAVLSVFAKPFVDNRIIDWGTGRISLMQSAGELLHRRANTNEHPLSQTSIAQQLVQQNTKEERPNVLPEQAQPEQVIVTPADSEIKSNTQLIKPPLNANKLVKKVTLQENNVLTTNIPAVVDEKEAEINLIVSNNFPKNDFEVEKPKVIPVRKQSISDIAFERTDSSKTQFENPYAKQVASLIDQPLPANTSTTEFDNAYQQVLASNQPQKNPFSSLTTITESTFYKKKAAALISSVEPRYPSIAKRKGIELDVLVRFVINEDGRVTDIEFEDKNRVSYFRNAIRSAMNKWRFLPATVNNRPIESQMAKIFSFSLVKGYK